MARRARQLRATNNAFARKETHNYLNVRPLEARTVVFHLVPGLSKTRTSEEKKNLNKYNETNKKAGKNPYFCAKTKFETMVATLPRSW